MGIYKEKEIIRAYSGFRRLGIRDLLFGDIINLTPGRTVWWPAANWAEAAAQRGIIAFQRWKYSNSPLIYCTHSIIHLMDGVCWNVTAPKADYLKLEEGKLNPDKVYIVCRQDMPFYPTRFQNSWGILCSSITWPISRPWGPTQRN